MLFRILDKPEFRRLVEIILGSNEVIGPKKVTTDQDEPPEKVDRAAEARAALSRAEAYRRAHPGEWDEIIAEYQGVVSKFPGTEAASFAEKTVKEARKKKEMDGYLSKPTI